MAYVLDLAVILVFVLSVVIGYRRGVVRSLSRLIGLVLAVVVAFSLSGVVANTVYDRFVEPMVQSTIEKQIDETASTGEAASRNGVATVLEELPAPLLNLLKNNDVGTVDQVMDKLIVDDSQELFNGGELAEALTEQIVRPVGVSVLRLLAFPLILVLAWLLVLLLSGLIDKLVGKIPFVNGLNNGLGALFGALQGAVLALIVVAIVQMVASMEAVPWLTQAHIDHTILTGPLSEINPVGHFFQSVLLTFAE